MLIRDTRRCISCRWWDKAHSPDTLRFFLFPFVIVRLFPDGLLIPFILPGLGAYLHSNPSYGMRKQRKDGFLLLLTILALCALANALCYYPDGRSQTSDEYRECPYLNGTISMCCATNRNIPSGGNFSEGYTADGCLSNGLCKNKAEITNNDGSTFTATTYWREMCSMPDYGNSGCLDVCTNDSVY